MAIDMIHFLKVFSQMEGIQLPVNFDEMSFSEIMSYLKEYGNRLAANKTASETSFI